MVSSVHLKRIWNHDRRLSNTNDGLLILYTTAFVREEQKLTCLNKNLSITSDSAFDKPTICFVKPG
jgi:hypothetical protein